MSTVYLHVGPHKTGTTYLQKLWESHPEQLKQHNLVYPKVFYMAKGQHHIVTHLLSNNKGEAFQKGMSTLNNIEEDIILSSENFSSLTKKQFEDLRNALKGKKIKVVYYFRNPTQRFISKWQETIKHGGVVSFYEFYATNVQKPLLSNDLNPLLLLERLSQVFGKKNVYIIDYQNAYSTLSMMKEFQKVTGRKQVIQDIDVSVNSMSDLADIELIRIFNEKALQRNLLQQSNIREMYYSLLKQNIITNEHFKKEIVKHVTPIVLGDTFLDKRVYEILKQQYGDNFVNTLSKPKSRKYNVINDRYMMNENLMTDINHTFDILLKHVRPETD